MGLGIRQQNLEHFHEGKRAGLKIEMYIIN